MNQKHVCSGLSLVDVLVTMSVVAIVAGLGVPGMQAIVSQNRVAAATNEFVGALQLARSEAIKRGSGRVILKKTGVQWDLGWSVFVDYNNNQTLDDNGDANLCEAGEDCLIRDYSGLDSGYKIRPKNSRFIDWIGYDPSGRSTGSGGTNGTLYICPGNNDIKQARKVVINKVGRIRSSKFENGDSCPS